MKILLLSTHLDAGGITRYLYNLAQGLRLAGHEVIIVSRGGEWEPAFHAAGIECIFFPFYSKSIFGPSNLRLWPRLHRIIREKEIDVIHANTRITQCLAAFASRSTGVPYVTTLHGFYRRHVWRRFLKYAGDQTIAISQTVRDDLIRYFGIPPEHISVIYHGIDTALFNMVSSAAPSDYFRLGIFSRLSVEKGIETVIRVFSEIQSVFPKLTLSIAGKGKQESFLKDLVQDLRLATSVRFLGVMRPEDFFAGIDVLLFPSIKEGLGFSVLEAKASGKIVIASDGGSLKEIIRDKEDGFLIERFTAKDIIMILKSLTDPTMYERLSHNARASVQECTIARMAEETVAVYTKCREMK